MRVVYAEAIVIVRQPFVEGCLALSFHASFRPHLAVDALALLLASGSAITWHEDLHPVSSVPCPAHTLALSRCRKWERRRSGRWRQSAAALACVKTQCLGRL
jgi:hypothetical protein